MEIHIVCGVQISSDQLLCKLCMREQDRSVVQSDCFKKQKVAAAKMVNVTDELFPPIHIGANVTLAVSPVDRSPLDFQNIFGVVMAIENGVYQIGTKHGLIKGWFSRTDINLSGTQVAVNINDVPSDILLSVRQASSKQSRAGGQGYKKCNCKASKIQCRTKRCLCVKSNVLCNSKCHMSGSCCNK